VWNIEKLILEVTKTAIMTHNRDMNILSRHVRTIEMFLSV